jgi:hypothetical protein
VQIDGIDVRGFRVAGVSVAGCQDTRITRVYAHDNGFAGITSAQGPGGSRTRRFYLGDCVADNNPGDPMNRDNHSGNGIVVGGSDEVTIEYCEAMNNGWDMPREGNGPVGIWGYESDRLVIQHCISHDNKSPGADGGGFDLDGGMTNSVLQYNLSYHNVGCGYLLCQYDYAGVWKNNIVRYNLSVHDGAKNYQAGIGLWPGAGGFSDALIDHNTIINPRHAVSTKGDVPGMIYCNNIFVAGGDLVDGDFSHSRFENNLYWSTGKGAVCHGLGVEVPFTDDLGSVQGAGPEGVGHHIVGMQAEQEVRQHGVVVDPAAIVGWKAGQASPRALSIHGEGFDPFPQVHPAAQIRGVGRFVLAAQEVG